MRKSGYKLVLISRAKHFHVRNAAHKRHIFERLMSRTVCLGEKSRHSSDKFHGQVCDTNVCPYKFKCPECKKCCKRMNNRRSTAKRKPRCSAYHRLFRYSDIDKSFPQRLRKISDSSPVLSCHNNDPVIEIG